MGELMDKFKIWEKCRIGNDTDFVRMIFVMVFLGFATEIAFRLKMFVLSKVLSMFFWFLVILIAFFVVNVILLAFLGITDKMQEEEYDKVMRKIDKW